MISTTFTTALIISFDKQIKHACPSCGIDSYTSNKSKNLHDMRKKIGAYREPGFNCGVDLEISGRLAFSNARMVFRSIHTGITNPSISLRIYGIQRRLKDRTIGKREHVIIQTVFDTFCIVKNRRGKSHWDRVTPVRARCTLEKWPYRGSSLQIQWNGRPDEGSSEERPWLGHSYLITVGSISDDKKYQALRRWQYIRGTIVSSMRFYMLWQQLLTSSKCVYARWCRRMLRST